MNWLIPSVIATMTATAILAFCYFYLYRHDPKPYLKIWAISWALYFTRYIFMLGILLWQDMPPLLIGNQLVTLVSGILLLHGSYLFINKKIPRLFYGLAVLGGFWIIISILGHYPFMVMSLPTFGFLAGIYIWTGILFFRSEMPCPKESKAVGLAFIIWGIHKADYPFLRTVAWFAPWGYLLAAVLELAVALGLLMIYFRKTREELSANEQKLRENHQRLLNAQSIANVGDWSWDLETDELVWSEQTYRIFGQDPESFHVSVEAFDRAVHPDDTQDLIAKREAAIAENQAIEFEHRIVLPDNRIRYVHEISSITEMRQGTICRMTGTVQDITQRKQYELDLAASKEKFEKFFNTNPTPTFVWQSTEEDFQLVEVNDSARQLTHGRAQNYIGMKASEVYADLPLMQKKMHDCFSSRSTLEFEEYYKVRHSGDYEWVVFRLAYMAPDIVLMYTDIITQQKNAQTALVAAGEKWRQILLNSPQIGVSLNRDAEIILANDYFLTLTGWKREEVIGKDWFETFIPREDRKEIRKVFDGMMNQKFAFDHSNHENDIVTRSGTRLTVSWSNVLSRDPDGNILDVTCLGVDLTERKLHEHEITRQKRLFETMFNTIPDGVVITNTRREIQLANKGMETTFGYNPGELIGRETSILYATPETFRETGESVFNKEARMPGDLYITRYRHKNGREFSGETFGAKLYDEDGQWIGNLGVMRDITEREQAEMRVQQAQKMETIGTLAGGIAHDFNNILFPILGHSELLMDQISDGDKNAYDSLRQIHSSALRAKNLVHQILTFSRQENTEYRPLKLHLILKETLKFLRSTIPKDIEIIQDVDPHCGLVNADATQMHQIIMNLTTNACHAMETSGGTLRVALRQVDFGETDSTPPDLVPGSYACMSVSDTGGGIPPFVMEKIFEPYFTTKEKGKGTGIGLSVVHGIVQKMKGHIAVTSEPGDGSRFDIYLPMVERPDRDYQGTDSVRASLPRGRETILLVDDEAPIIELQRQMLERLGYRVKSRTSSLEALAYFTSRTRDFDLVITDLSMPNMTGDRLAAEILRIRPDVPVLLCTGFSEKFTPETAAQIGIADVLMKPIDTRTFSLKIRETLDKRNLDT